MFNFSLSRSYGSSKTGRRTRTGRSKTIKTKKTTRKLNDLAIKSLPKELLVDVLARVASSSFTDLFNAKLCCRDFLGAADEDYILEHVSINRFPVIPWFTRDEVVAFLNRCKDNGNPEALYRQGLGIQSFYFILVKMVIGTLIVHALDEKVRAYYNLERLWTAETSNKEQTQELEKAFVKVRRKNNSKKPVQSNG
ncbi:unnamed protein product [Ilex paraguariensis]|uniref:At2g35280-like TPR domain-containing protein n=1 Tax=Ilex paraguariensis TaxID=185542 RepID=A0ABC8QX38_9AQUA